MNLLRSLFRPRSVGAVSSRSDRSRPQNREKDDLRARMRVPVTPDIPLPPVAPDEPLVLIGDVHGKRALLQQMLARIAADWPGARICCLGDYIDRGEDSAGVIADLRARPDITCLKGNHEDLLLQFLDNPEATSAWLRHGGAETLRSFGVIPPEGRIQPGALIQAAESLRRNMGDGTEAWIRALPHSLLSGNLLLTHAGASPALAHDAQDAVALLWGAQDFLTQPRADGLWVAHGHVIVDAPFQDGARIALDTGAFAGGGLSAAHITPGRVAFLTLS